MTEKNVNKSIKASQREAQPKADGFFKRIFTKVDEAMKAKAENTCCKDSDSDGKGGKCC
jgi:hypothetical protein